MSDTSIIRTFPDHLIDPSRHKYFDNIKTVGVKIKKVAMSTPCTLQPAGMTGVITSDCAVPYLDASGYTIILYSFFFPETALSDWTHILHIKELTQQDKLFDPKY